MPDPTLDLTGERRDPRGVPAGVRMVVDLRVVAFPVLVLGQLSWVLFDPSRQSMWLVAAAAALVVWPLFARWYVISLPEKAWPRAWETIQADALFGFWFTVALGFDPVLANAIAIAALMNAVTTGSLLLLAKTAVAALLGVGLGLLFPHLPLGTAPAAPRLIVGLTLAFHVLVVSRQLYFATLRARRRRHEAEERQRQLTALSTRLARYLSPQLYAQVFAPDEGTQHTEARRKPLTVFFSDIVGFTGIVEGHDPKQVSAFLNQYLEEMSTIALEHGGTIDKFIGDAVMVFFGDPVTLGPEADARRCCKMALAMQQRVRVLDRRWRDLGLPEIRVRMGIHSGPCMVGDFGSGARMDYTAMGHAVNVASRLENAANPGTVWISDETRALAGGSVRCVERGELTLRGIRGRIRAWEIEEADETQLEVPLNLLTTALRTAGLAPPEDG